MISSVANLVYDLPHKLPNDLQLRILRNKEILGKSLIWVETEPSAQSAFQKLKFGNSSKKKHVKVDIKLFLSCPFLLDFYILFQLFCPGLSEQTKFWS